MSERLAAWQELSRLTVDCDRMDRRFFRELLRESENLRRAASRAAESWPEGLPLLQDLFSSVFKPCPVLKEEAEVRPSVLLNHAVMSRLIGFPEWERLRRSTVLDRSAAALAAAYLLDFLLTHVPRDPALQQALDAGRQAARAGQSADALTYAVGRAEEAAVESARWGTAVREIVQRQESVLSNTVYGAVLKARRYVEQALDSLDGLGVSDAERQSMALDDQLNLMIQALNPNLVRVAQLARQHRQLRQGRLERQVCRPIGELWTIERGRSLSQLIPSELAMLGHPLGKAEFLRRWSEGQTMQYAFRQRVRNVPPPLILMLDTSGSTEEWVVENQYQRRDWIASVAVALLDMARADGREMAAVHFGTILAPDGREVPACAVHRYPAGKARAGERLELASVWIGGSTPVYDGYLQAVALMRDNPALRGADIVCITDGQWSGWPDTLRAAVDRDRQELGFRFTGVVVGEGNEECFRPIADVILHARMDAEGFLTLTEALRRA